MIPTNCPNCESKDIRWLEMPDNIKALAGKYRAVCDACGYAWQVNTDTTTKELRPELPLEAINFIREKVGKTKLEEKKK